MLVSLKFNNAYIFSQETSFSLKADMRNKRLSSNVIETSVDSVLKSACIYGSNNSGKTCLVRIIRALWSVILSQPGDVTPNLFSNNSVVSISCVFIQDEKEWEYSFSLDTKTMEFIFERFSRIDYDQYRNSKEIVYFERDFINQKFYTKDTSLQPSIHLMGRKNILIHVVDVATLPYLEEARNVLMNFANKIVIVDMNNIPLDNTIMMLKNHDSLQKDIVSFIKNADLDLEDFKYEEKNLPFNLPEQKPSEDVIAMQIKQSFEDTLRLTSVYKGVPLPSLLFDSTGTKKIAALASYVVSALKNGLILVVDELDSSIHFKLTRSIVSMFNNELNDKAQLIFTAHDVSLMDCKKLFRKEQIWFVHKDEDGVYLYSLADFTAKDGVRDTTDIIEKYNRGVLGAIPDPDMIETLLQVKNDK
ncbi:MAG: ATP-binding protein [Spirochaetaceae bacterium]|nr:ATP-binding protein [Spirochaetaceae bacterium]